MSKFKFTCIITTTVTWVVSCINNLRTQDETTDKHNFLQLEVLKQNETSILHIEISQYLNTCWVCSQASALSGAGHLAIFELCLNSPSTGQSTSSNVSKKVFLVVFTWSQNEDLDFPAGEIKFLSLVVKKKKIVPYLGRVSLDGS